MTADMFVKLDQCLFGYEDGHRLLSTSRKLPEEATSQLLLHSDLVPGVDMHRRDGYWTGIPVPAMRAYALMHTWLAPEMPRPGCVWTQAILIPFGEMARLPDLAVLRTLFFRPSVSMGFGGYASPVTIDPLDVTSMGSTSISEEVALRVLRAVYAPPFHGLAAGDKEPIEAEIFAIWSQQWPRLRRMFSFRTAGSVTDPSNKTHFDLRVIRAPLSPDVRAQFDGPEKSDEWEREAIDDLLTSGRTAFRRFLWRYGSDIRRGRRRYKFLAQMFLATRASNREDASLTHAHLSNFTARDQTVISSRNAVDDFSADLMSGEDFRRVVDAVVQVLPDADDGKLLKDELLSCGSSTYSLLPAVDPIDVLRYFLGHPQLTALRFPSENIFDAVKELWPTRAPDILQIAEQAVADHPDISVGLLEWLSKVADPETFLAQSRTYPAVRERIVRANLSLLDSSDLVSLSKDELFQFLTLLPDDRELVGHILDRLLFSDDHHIAGFFSDRFLDLTQARVFDALISELSGTSPHLPRVWADTVRQHSPDLAGLLLELVTTTTALGVLAGWLGLNVMEGLKASPAKWAATLVRARDDIHGYPRQRLLAFLLALALARPKPGCEALFEIAFESVHADIWFSKLPYDAFNALAPLLPDLPWWQQWDTCLRLRRAVVTAYIDANLDPSSFRRLANDRELREQLHDVASDTRAGRDLLRRM